MYRSIPPFSDTYALACVLREYFDRCVQPYSGEGLERRSALGI